MKFPLPSLFFRRSSFSFEVCIRARAPTSNSVAAARMHVCTKGAFTVPPNGIFSSPPPSKVGTVLELASSVRGFCIGKAIAARRKGRGISIPFRTSLEIDEGVESLKDILVNR